MKCRRNYFVISLLKCMFIGGKNVKSSLPQYENEKLEHPGDLWECFVGFGVGVFTFYKALRGASVHRPPRHVPRLIAESTGGKCLLPTSLIYFLFRCFWTVRIVYKFTHAQMFYLGAFFVSHIYSKPHLTRHWPWIAEDPSLKMSLTARSLSPRV